MDKMALDELNQFKQEHALKLPHGLVGAVHKLALRMFRHGQRFESDEGKKVQKELEAMESKSGGVK